MNHVSNSKSLELQAIISEIAALKDENFWIFTIIRILSDIEKFRILKDLVLKKLTFDEGSCELFNNSLKLTVTTRHR